MKRLRAGWDWALGFSLMGLGGLLLALASLRVSDSRYVSDQLSHLVSGGLGGLLLLAAGSTLVITAGLHDEWRKLDRVEDALPFPRVPEPSAAVLVRRGRVLAGAGMLLAVAFLVVAWARVSGKADVEPGLEAVSIGVIGLVIGGLVTAFSTLWLKRRLQLRKSRLFAPWAPTDTAGPTQQVAHVPSGRVLVATGLTRYHAPGCVAVKGVATHEVDLADVPPGLEPCDLCHTSVSDLGRL